MIFPISDKEWLYILINQYPVMKMFITMYLLPFNAFELYGFWHFKVQWNPNPLATIRHKTLCFWDFGPKFANLHHLANLKDFEFVFCKHHFYSRFKQLLNTLFLYVGVGGTVGQHAVIFALIANSHIRAPVLSALCIVSQAWSTMQIPIWILTKFQVV